MKKSGFYFVTAFVLWASASFSQAPVISPISGPANICFDPSTTAVFSVSATNSPSSYAWYVMPSTGVQIQNPGSAISPVSFGNINGTYTVYCSATNASGTSLLDSFVVNVFEKPNVTFSGLITFCQGSSTNLSASPTIIPASSTLNSGSTTLFYTWSLPAGLNTTVGPTVIANPTVTTTYTVSVLNGVCTSTTPLTLYVNPLPSVSVTSGKNPICTGEAVSLTAFGTPRFKWSTGDSINPISVSPATTTNYTVTGISLSNCSASVVITQSVSLCTAINERQLNGLDQVNLFPNPSAGMLTLDLGTLSGTELTIQIRNAIGQCLLDEKTTASMPVYDISFLKSGVYVVVLKQAQMVRLLKLIKE